MQDSEIENAEMTEREASVKLFAITKFTTDRLNTEQMAILVLVSATGGDPRPTKCWPTVKPLFAGTKDDVPHMHSEIARMIGLIAGTRLDDAESDRGEYHEGPGMREDYEPVSDDGMP